MTVFLVLFQLCVIISAGQDIRVKWYVLGPFACGMNEMDGIPIVYSSNHSAIQNPYHLPTFPTKKDRKLKFHSEFHENGVIKWMKVTPNRKRQLQVHFPSIQWNPLVQSMHRTEVLQWQAWLKGQFKLKKKTKIKITCFGLNTFWINEVGPIAADQYGNRPFPYISILPAGTHSITSLIRAKHQTQLQCIIHAFPDEEHNIRMSVDSNFIPDVIDGQLATSILGITIQNLSPIAQIVLKTVHILHEMDFESFLLQQTQPHWPYLYPNQISTLPVYMDSDPQIHTCDTKLTVTLRFVFEIVSLNHETKQQTLNQRLEFRCRQQGQSFKFTFLDRDGSIQYAAAIHPLLSSTPLSPFPVLVNLHGTSVTASNSADSYKYKENSSQKEYTFGVENTWVLAPTRHGAHNWEGIGKSTAMRALEALIQIARTKTTYPADDTRIIFAGHSMGGHGAWILATSFPDLALAVVPQAGWFRKEYYGDSNTLFLHDLQNSFVESQLKAILEATIQENAIELHLSNVKDVPCFVRIGSNDQTVHPWWSRRIIRLLHELYPNVNDKAQDHPYIKYHEIPFKEHWWWDTLHDNDGGVANDEEIRSYFKRILSPLYSNVRPPVPTCRDQEFTLTVYNPVSVSSKNGIRILQTWKSYQKATLSVQCQSDTINENDCICTIFTRNVRRFEMNLSQLFNGEWSTKLMIDDSVFPVDKKTSTKSVMLCSYNEWRECEDSIHYDLTERSPVSYGPMRQVFERTFRIVYGTNGSDEMKLKYQQWSVYLANLWYMTGDCGNIRIHSDMEESMNLHEAENVLLIGDSSTNEWSKILLNQNEHLIDFRIEDGFIRIGPCVYTKSFGFMSIFPVVYHSNLHLGAIIGGSDLDRMYEIILMAKPTIPPMTRQPFSNTIPDYILIGDDTFSKGFGGVLASGFWRYDWKWDASTSYMPFCHLPVQDNETKYVLHDSKREL